MFICKPTITPINKEPAAFTRKVPAGNLPAWFILFDMNQRSTAPMDPPAPTARN
ncbi:hypothetical protein L7D49_06475 [Sporosarcina sp. MB25]|nr:hypothetical protein [Sporosarcina cyprini]MCG3087559.1 hypothetical protein [Sporosarcina cyprini]